jgi:hypothetical protein
MKTIKHTGKIKNTGNRVAVVFRTLPGESDQALVLPIHTLPDAYHDSLMNMMETDQAQDAFELGEIMFIRSFPDGRPMLQAMQQDNRLLKVATDNVVMTPGPNTEIPLAQLNELIAEQKNCAIDELYKFVKGAPSKQNTDSDQIVETLTEEVSETISQKPVEAPADAVLSDKDLAKSYRSQADTLYKEAARLRREAEELDPTPKKTTKKKEAVNN